MRWAHPYSLALWEALAVPMNPDYLNIPVVGVGVRHNLKSEVLEADFCGQTVDDPLHLLHNLGDLPAPQVHLCERGRHSSHLRCSLWALAQGSDEMGPGLGDHKSALE